MLPVRESRHDDAVEVGDDGRQRLRILGRVGGQFRPHPAGGHLRPHGPRGERLPVGGDPVDHLPALAAEAFRVEWRSGVAA